MKVGEAKRKLLDAAQPFGGHIEDDGIGRDVNLQVCAPEGKWWRASDGPHIVVATARGPQSWLDEAVIDGVSRIMEGTRDAEDES